MIYANEPLGRVVETLRDAGYRLECCSDAEAWLTSPEDEKQVLVTAGKVDGAGQPCSTDYYHINLDSVIADNWRFEGALYAVVEDRLRYWRIRLYQVEAEVEDAAFGLMKEGGYYAEVTFSATLRHVFQLIYKCVECAGSVFQPSMAQHLAARLVDLDLDEVSYSHPAARRISRLYDDFVKERTANGT